MERPYGQREMRERSAPLGLAAQVAHRVEERCGSLRTETLPRRRADWGSRTRPPHAGSRPPASASHSAPSGGHRCRGAERAETSGDGQRPAASSSGLALKSAPDRRTPTRKSLPTVGPNRLQNLLEQAEACVLAAAPVVLPPVDRRVQELVDQVALAGSDLDAVGTGLTRAQRRRGVLGDRLLDLLRAHGPAAVVVAESEVPPVRRTQAILVLGEQAAVRHVAGVADLHDVATATTLLDLQAAAASGAACAAWSRSRGTAAATGASRGRGRSSR